MAVDIGAYYHNSTTPSGEGKGLTHVHSAEQDLLDLNEDHENAAKASYSCLMLQSRGFNPHLLGFVIAENRSYDDFKFPVVRRVD